MEVPDDLQENLLNESENEINEDKQPTSKTKKERERFRLAFASLMLFGHYFAYDSIGAVGPFLKSALNFTLSDIGWMYSSPALPNLVLLLLGGIIVDKFGTTATGLFFSTAIVLGAVVVAIATSFWVMFLGRFLLGVGEIMFVIQSSVFTKWFKGKELTLSFSVGHMVGRAGTLMSLTFLPQIATAYSYKIALWVAAATCVFSFLFWILLVVTERAAERFDYHSNLKDFAPLPQHDSNNHNTPNIEDENSIGLEIQEKSDGVTSSDGGHSNTAHEIEINNAPQSSGGHHGGGSLSSLRDIGKFPPVFLFLCLVLCFFYGTIIPFIGFAVTVLNKSYGYSEEAAGQIASILSFMSLVSSPIFGILIDYIGLRTTLLLVGSGMSLPVFFLMAMTDLNPIPFIIILGVAYSFIPGILFSSVSLVVEPHMVGTAFGLAYISEEIGLFIIPILIGYASDKWGFKTGLLMFGFLTLIEFGCCVLIKLSKHRNVLDTPSKKMKSHIMSYIKHKICGNKD